ncbi:LLM class flavin-dependent oxidoreductase [Rhizobium leguminosarum]|uniref:LLM class flavin-dependent oxidoreductase n=1 Tax=Rhizobium leguminosarum TaxID=384 RepID=UPI001C985B86|nr:LLM class flavin-dependent oxidoreductase [Rhizobium leguminosarum]
MLQCRRAAQRAAPPAAARPHRPGGSLRAGLDFAATYGEIIYCSLLSLPAARAFRDELRRRAIAKGRDVGSWRVVPGLVPIIGRSREEALERHEAVSGTGSEEGLLRRLPGMLRSTMARLIPMRRSRAISLRRRPINSARQVSRRLWPDLRATSVSRRGNSCGAWRAATGSWPARLTMSRPISSPGGVPASSTVSTSRLRSCPTISPTSSNRLCRDCRMPASSPDNMRVEACASASA